MLLPGTRDYAAYLPTYNLRTARAPAVRALCSTEAAVADVLNWIRREGLSFAVRGGGHSFEGYSESSEVVIDLRGLNAVAYDAAQGVVHVGAGASLEKIYAALTPRGLAIAAGTCPLVGVAAHVLGGGYGLLSRRYGLACDKLRGLGLVDAQSAIRVVDKASAPDLLWASQGGGGGSFGIATRLTLAVHPVANAVVFGVSWSISDVERAVRVVAAWQSRAAQPVEQALVNEARQEDVERLIGPPREIE